MLDDYVMLSAAAVVAACVVILASFLVRYGKLVKEANTSTRLAKDVWDSVNTRFGVVDTRIIDLMAKTEVLTARLNPAVASAATNTNKTPPEAQKVTYSPAATPAPIVVQPRQDAMLTSIHAGESTETEKRVLRFLVEGPRDSAQIRGSVGRSREHTARLMKSLFERGLVSRNDRNKPYVYEITDSGRSYLVS